MSIETHHCLNCGAEYEGNYCPFCGQSSKVKRITASNICETFVSHVAGLQANLPRTLIGLFYRPGYLIADYLAGKRKVYSNPFSTVLLLTTIFLFLNQYIVSYDIRDSSKAFGQEITQMDGSNPSNDMIDPDILYGNTINFIYGNFAIFNLIGCLILTIPFWLAFRKQGLYRHQPLNIYEAATAMAYFTCTNLIISIISLPFTTGSTIGLITIIGWLLIIPLFILTCWQMFQIRFGAFLKRLLVFLCYSILISFISIIVPSFIYGIILVLSDGPLPQR